MKSDEQLHKIRHSLAHILAAVMQYRHPEAKFGVGPVVDNGFYYDMRLDETIKLEALESIAEDMAKMISQNIEFIKEDWPIDKAIDYFKKNNQDYKVELLNDLKQKGTTAVADAGDQDIFDSKGGSTSVTVYKTGDFTDLCRGPHVKNTNELKDIGYKLTKIAGAYWRGNEKNDQLQRIYGVAFTTESELSKFLTMLEEADRRDHRKLGKELDLFTFSNLIGPGLPLWTPKGTILRNQLDGFVQEMRDEYGFEEVTIPHITKKEAYITSGHWDKFENELFKINTRDGHEFAMKPMNCPHHTQIFDSKPRSYKDLPVRYRETTMVYRDEQSGELNGLERLRAITQDDAHIFCRPSQVKDEVLKVWDIVERFWGAFGIKLKVRLSTHDSKDKKSYLGTEAQWESAERQLADVVESYEVEYSLGVGDAAFYGPKIDFMGKDALGREFQASTIQLDFNMPERFKLSSIDENGEKETVTMIHCAINGSLERSLVILIEHFAGAFPLWLSPEQVRILPISDKFTQYAKEVMAKLKSSNVRTVLDDSAESLGKRIRNAEVLKTPYVLVVGEKEQASGKVAVRKYQEGDLGAVDIDELITTLVENIKKRNL